MQTDPSCTSQNRGIRVAAVVFPLLLIVGLTALRRSKGGAAQ